jgi:hypothetical protein
MAVPANNPYSGDPSVPRKVTPRGVQLDPLQAQGPDTAPASPQVPGGAPGAAGAMSINQLPDGAGGAVTVPPPSMAPSAVGPGIVGGFRPPSSMTPGPGIVGGFQPPPGFGSAGKGFQIPSGPNINPIPSTPATLADPAPAPITSTAPASVPGSSTFGADQNLIQTQINPAGSPRLLNTQGIADTALDKVANGPDRVALGKSYYDTFATQAKGNFDRAIHDATSAAAAHGQIGSGQLTNRYGDLTEAFNRENTGAASDFATHALEGTIGDRLNTLGAARGAENSIYGQEANARNELRGERGYQQSLAEQAIAQRIAQNQMEQGQQSQDFGQAATIYGLGNQGDPTGAYQDAATLSSSEAGANSADVAALLRLFAQRRNPVPSGVS